MSRDQARRRGLSLTLLARRASVLITDEPEPTNLAPPTHLPDLDTTPLNQLRPPRLTPDHHLDTEIPMEFWLEGVGRRGIQSTK